MDGIKDIAYAPALEAVFHAEKNHPPRVEGRGVVRGWVLGWVILFFRKKHKGMCGIDRYYIDDLLHRVEETRETYLAVL